MSQRREGTNRLHATMDFWALARESIADADARIRSAACLIELAQTQADAAPDVLRAELAGALADLSAAADRVDARLAGLVALPLVQADGPFERTDLP